MLTQEESPKGVMGAVAAWVNLAAGEQDAIQTLAPVEVQGEVKVVAEVVGKTVKWQKNLSHGSRQYIGSQA